MPEISAVMQVVSAGIFMNINIYKSVTNTRAKLHARDICSDVIGQSGTFMNINIYKSVTNTRANLHA